MTGSLPRDEAAVDPGSLRIRCEANPTSALAASLMDGRSRVRDDAAVNVSWLPRPKWIAWSLAVIAVACYPLTLYLGLSAPAAVPPVLQLGWYGSVGSLVGIAYCLVGALIVRRHPRHAIGWLASAGGFGTSICLFAGSYAAFALGRHPLPGFLVAAWLRTWLWLPATFGLLYTLIPALFPDGHFLSRRWRVLIWATAFSSLAQVLSATLNPFGSGPRDSLTPVGIFYAAGAIAGLAAIFGAVAAVVVRFRRSRGVERQQMKWFVAAAVLQGVLWAASLPPSAILRVAPYQVPYFDVLIPFALLALPIAIGIGILRYRLYDIDLVLSRGLIYGALAAFIAAAYLLIVVGAGLVVGTGGRPNLGFSIVATAVVAVLFQPVRSRVQTLANNLVYGVTSNPYQALAAIARSSSARDADRALAGIAHAVAMGSRADRVRIRLLLSNGQSRLASWPDASSDHLPTKFPVRHEGDVVGEVELAGSGDPSLTEALAAQAALALRNLRLSAELDDKLGQIEAQAAELSASRTRLVKAQETERRRLERDLHDGVQQEVVALIAQLRLARNQLGRDPELAAGTLSELQAGMQHLLADLRDLAHGIHPAVLASRGLVEAVESIARRAPISVRIEADDRSRESRFAPEIEGAAYYVTAEGLANVLKHSGASRATVKIATLDSELRVAVGDDGCGFAGGQAAESGLRGLRDRIEALGGDLRIESGARGTRLVATLPARDRAHV